MQVDFTYLELCALFANAGYMVSKIWDGIGEPSNSREYEVWRSIETKLSIAVNKATEETFHDMSEKDE